MAQNQFDLEAAENEAFAGATNFYKQVEAVMTPSVGHTTLMSIVEGKAIEEALKFVGADYYNALDDIEITADQRDVVNLFIKEYQEFYSNKYKHL